MYRPDFFSEFDRQLALLDGAPAAFAMTLRFALLEVMAAALHPKQSNGKRFVALVRIFADWPDTDRVSLQQIQASKRSAKCPALRAEVDRRLHGWELGARIWRGSEKDPFADELTAIAEPTVDEAKVAADLIDRCRYVSLLWKLRNFRAHESHSPASEFPFDQPPEPYYYLRGLSEGDYRLVTPDALVRVIALRCAANLRVWFETKDRDPYDSFPDLKSWID